MRLYSDKEIKELEDAAVKACVNRIKNHVGSNTMTEAVEKYLTAIVSPLTPDSGEAFFDHRSLAAQRLAIQCIYALSNEQLKMLDRELEHICMNPPRQGVRQKRGRHR